MKKFIFLEKVLMAVFLTVFMLGTINVEARNKVPPKDGGDSNPTTSDEGATPTSKEGEAICYDDDGTLTVLPIDIFNPSDEYDPTDIGYNKEARILNIVVVGYTILDKDLSNANRDIDVGETQRFNLEFSPSEMAAILANEVDHNGVLTLDIRIKFKQRDVGSTTQWWNIAPAFVTYINEWEECSDEAPRLAQNINEIDLKVSPNPTKDNLNVDFNVENRSEVSISIFNSVGREVKSIFFSKTLEEGIYNERISLEGLSNGVYYLVMKKGDEVFTEKLVKI